MYILIGLIAIGVAFGHSDHQANNRGALQAVEATPVGGLALWLLAVGVLGLALWRLAQAAYGAPGPDGRRPSTRLIALVKAALGHPRAFELRYAGSWADGQISAGCWMR